MHAACIVLTQLSVCLAHPVCVCHCVCCSSRLPHSQSRRSHQGLWDDWWSHFDGCRRTIRPLAGKDSRVNATNAVLFVNSCTNRWLGVQCERTWPADSVRTQWRRIGREPSHIRRPQIDFLLLPISYKAACHYNSAWIVLMPYRVSQSRCFCWRGLHASNYAARDLPLPAVAAADLSSRSSCYCSHATWRRPARLSRHHGRKNIVFRN